MSYVVKRPHNLQLDFSLCKIMNFLVMKNERKGNEKKGEGKGREGRGGKSK